MELLYLVPCPCDAITRTVSTHTSHLVGTTGGAVRGWEFQADVEGISYLEAIRGAHCRWFLVRKCEDKTKPNGQKKYMYVFLFGASLIRYAGQTAHGAPKELQW